MFGVSKVLGVGPAAAQEQAASKHEPPPTGILYIPKERIVNLADTGSLRYVKIVVAMEIHDPGLKGKTPKGEEYKKYQEELGKELKPFAPLLDDQITSVVSTKTVSQLVTAEGKQRLKEELLDRFNHVLHEHKVLNVYFSEFVIQ
jgi:flagellar FliL protein